MKQYWLSGIRKLTFGIVFVPFSVAKCAQVGQKKPQTASAKVNCVVKQEKNILKENQLMLYYFRLL